MALKMQRGKKHWLAKLFLQLHKRGQNKFILLQLFSTFIVCTNYFLSWFQYY